MLQYKPQYLVMLSMIMRQPWQNDRRAGAALQGPRSKGFHAMHLPTVVRLSEVLSRCCLYLLFLMLAGYSCRQLWWSIKTAGCVAQEVVSDAVVRLRGGS